MKRDLGYNLFFMLVPGQVNIISNLSWMKWDFGYQLFFMIVPGQVNRNFWLVLNEIGPS